MNYLIVKRIPGGYSIKADMDYNPEKYQSWKFYGFSKRDSIKHYRELFNLRFRRLALIEI